MIRPQVFLFSYLPKPGSKNIRVANMIIQLFYRLLVNSLFLTKEPENVILVQQLTPLENFQQFQNQRHLFSVLVKKLQNESLILDLKQVCSLNRPSGIWTRG
jgi:hypothetical protein